MGRANIPVQNLYSDCSAVEIRKGLSEIENISNIYISLEDASVIFNFKRANDLSKVENQLSFLGFPPQGE
ncbi:hypothetical protein GWK08_12980 [Leptobacterium flavescens]|uniref:HMA domain-containing protein n=1 Tax=Leptobacterium flavescens TaxID=472055 RepID=A0A6P0UPH4_9FLAO|nr:hypothetical protein [Leptobacterium flavescens]NER14360.1 hypothetical protein [Leptobacterium flavescens]